MDQAKVEVEFRLL